LCRELTAGRHGDGGHSHGRGLRVDETILKQRRDQFLVGTTSSRNEPLDINDVIDIGSFAMPHENNQAGLDFAEVWRAAQHRRTDDIAASEVDILKTVAVFCGFGLLVSLILAVSGLDIVGLF
jgi:hypothetical protein